MTIEEKYKLAINALIQIAGIGGDWRMKKKAKKINKPKPMKKEVWSAKAIRKFIAAKYKNDGSKFWNDIYDNTDDGEISAVGTDYAEDLLDSEWGEYLLLVVKEFGDGIGVENDL
jgi:hypothetical protein